MVLDFKLKDGSWSRLRADQAREAVPAAAPAPVAEISAEDFSARAIQG